MHKLEAVRALMPLCRDLILKEDIHRLSFKNNDFTDIVTDIDVKVQTFLIDELTKLEPESSFFAEEGISEQGHKLWVIDPIDGTKNFYRRKADYGISIAYYEENEILFGVVYDVIQDIIYCAEKGKGAWRDDQTLHCTDKALHQVSVDMNLNTTMEFIKMGAQMDHLAKSVFASRNLGSAALSLCHIAAGYHDVYLNRRLSLWDFAAGKLILEEAGGKVRFPYHPDEGMNRKSVFLWAASSENILDKINEKLFEEK